MRKMSKYETQEELKREELSQEGQLLKTEVDNAKLTGDSMDVKMTDASEESKTNNTAGENKMGTMPMGKLLISVSSRCCRNQYYTFLIYRIYIKEMYIMEHSCNSLKAPIE